MLNLKRIHITPSLLNLISEIDEFKGYWAALDAHTTRLQFMGDVATHQQSFRALFDAFRDRRLDEDVLKKLNGVITGQKGASSYRDKNFPVVVQDGPNIIGTVDTASPEEVRQLMPKLVDWLENALKDGSTHPLLVIGLFGAVFMLISPFERGNGRLMRMLITLIMFRAGYGYAPYSRLDQPARENAVAYHETLQEVQISLDEGKPEWGEWLTYFLFVLKAQKDGLAERLEKEKDALTEMPELSRKIMALFDQHERLQMKEIERLTRGRRATLKLRLGELVEGGYLKRHGRARSTWYSLV